MTISELMLILVRTLNEHGDLTVTACCLEDEVRKATILQKDAVEWTEGTVATEIFLEG